VAFTPNSWQRIGILLSVAWVIWAAVDADNSNQEQASAVHDAVYQQCLDAEDIGAPIHQNCTDKALAAEEEIQAGALGDIEIAVEIALAAIALAWLAAYALIAVVRWIRAGFKRG
jgi:hypothetical protein